MTTRFDNASIVPWEPIEEPIDIQGEVMDAAPEVRQVSPSEDGVFVALVVLVSFLVWAIVGTVMAFTTSMPPLMVALFSILLMVSMVWLLLAARYGIITAWMRERTKRMYIGAWFRLKDREMTVREQCVQWQRELVATQAQPQQVATQAQQVAQKHEDPQISITDRGQTRQIPKFTPEEGAALAWLRELYSSPDNLYEDGKVQLKATDAAKQVLTNMGWLEYRKEKRSYYFAGPPTLAEAERYF